MSTTFRTGVRLALDWGEARIGVAACDASGTLAYPVRNVAAGERALSLLLGLVSEYEPIEIVVGLPRSLSGGEGPAAVRTRAHAAELVAALASTADPPPVRLVDERLTTVTAAQRLSQSGRRAREQRQIIDQAAAVAILEHALEIERARNTPPGELLSAAEFPPRPPAAGQQEETH
ncbi:Holliday junction resolvase RuvX [Microlunatus panaciterrae]|uniref:Putative pre-16S rRNA nuclease n=1 Tax=Microlunatus panaciterrae TaxID=400768 RepID=A0ABS2RH61_9ACTN|nr:Holliday junction resolvase RuvX [Microlunatus panaciterrae]MBM7797269.1 putative Holliday junction resolvase [Microlunatus panaciterrae]